MLGSWNVDVKVGSMPQKVATAVAKLSESLMGAEYTPIAYLGSQVANGTNHAVLAEQLVVTGRDTKNVVILIFNEKPNEMEATLVSIERVVETGGELGGIAVDVKTDIPEDAQEAYNSVFEGRVGIKVTPIALLGTQVTKGTDYIFIAECEPVVQNPEKVINLIIINAMTKNVAFVDVLTSKCDSMQLGYSFTWLKNKNTSLGKPLGEWP